MFSVRQTTKINWCNLFSCKVKLTKFMGRCHANTSRECTVDCGSTVKMWDNLLLLLFVYNNLE